MENEKITELNAEELNEVAGGTFDTNKFDERIYNQAGLRTKYHFIKKDEFFILDSKGKEVSITYSQANEAVRMWQNTGNQPSYEDVVKYVRD